MKNKLPGTSTSALRCAKVPFLAALMLAAPAAVSAASAQPPLALANVYQDDVEVGDYMVSEKLDGVRAYWDGEQLISRAGNVFAAPAWFMQGFPAAPMDGELWLGRGRFEKTLSIVSRAAPHAGWREIRFMVFDLPQHEGPFSARNRALGALIAKSDSPYLEKVRQFTVADKAALQKTLEEVTESGGEGLILRRKDAPHKAGRSDDFLKLKAYYDAEARVVGHNPGQGRLAGMMGSITVETPAGLRFKIGTGFTDEERRKPPPLGSTISYRYNGFTNTGRPRFPSFLRIRAED